MSWGNIEKIAVAYLKAVLPAEVRVSTEKPPKLEDELPFVLVTRGPGDDDKLNDRPLLDVETFASTRDGMWVLAEQTRQALHALAGSVVNGRLIDTVRTASGPQPVDYRNPAVRRAVASYRLVQRAR